jgi:FAD/FMN-containing dehydrogenase
VTDGLLAALEAAVGRDGLIVDPDVAAPYLIDWRGRFHGRARAIVRPASTGETSRVVAICASAGVAMVPQGGNTGLAAGATPVDLDDAVVINLARMRTILALDPHGSSMRVQSGCVLSDVQAAAVDAGRLFPLSLAAEGSAQIGGLISTNAGGTAVLRYGSMRSLILGLEVVLPDGTILDGMRGLRKDNAGYDWKQWFVGAEGTLGIVTAAVLRLFPIQHSARTALFSLASIGDAMRAFDAVENRLGELIVAAELIPDVAVAARSRFEPGEIFPAERDGWYLLVEATSALPGLEEAIDSALLEIIERGIASACTVATNASQRTALWTWRESITETERRMGQSAKHDVSVPVSAMAGFVEEAAAFVNASFPAATVIAFGHAGDGNVHFNVVLPPDGSIDSEAVHALVHEIVARYGGSITAEHGIGRYRRDELPGHRSVAEMEAMRTLKRALDPRGLMNPGAVF